MRTLRTLLALAATASLLALAGDAHAAVWAVPGDFPTLQAAMDSSLVASGDTIRVDPGRRPGATVTKAVTILAQGRVVIVGGPTVSVRGKAGFLFPGSGAGSGASILGFRFEGVEFPVFSRGADDVSVSGNTLVRPEQGVTSWAVGTWGKGWDIVHNTILELRTNCGGGIGVLVGDYAGGTVTGNLVAHNEVRGTVRVPTGDCGGYDAPGIVLFADWRYPGDTGAAIERNRVTKNRVFTASSNAGLVPVSGVELSDTRDLATELVIKDNEVVYNDLRGMSVPVALTPDELGPPTNRIEANRIGPVDNWPDRKEPGPDLLLRRPRLRLLRSLPEGPSPVR